MPACHLRGQRKVASSSVKEFCDRMFHWPWNMEVFFHHWDLCISLKTANSQAPAHKIEISNHACIQLKPPMHWEDLVGPNSSTEVLFQNYDSINKESVTSFSDCHLQTIKMAARLPTKSLMKGKDDAFIQKLGHRPSKRNFWQYAFDSKVMQKTSLLFLRSRMSCVSLEESFLFIHLSALFRQPD